MKLGVFICSTNGSYHPYELLAPESVALTQRLPSVVHRPHYVDRKLDFLVKN